MQYGWFLRTQGRKFIRCTYDDGDAAPTKDISDVINIETVFEPKDATMFPDMPTALSALTYFKSLSLLNECEVVDCTIGQAPVPDENDTAPVMTRDEIIAAARARRKTARTHEWKLKTKSEADAQSLSARKKTGYGMGRF